VLISKIYHVCNNTVILIIEVDMVVLGPCHSDASKDILKQNQAVRILVILLLLLLLLLSLFIYIHAV
jgi:hypothetical protein